jgi:ubiquinone/menaquinone biosynthesis C-methylase UbiE
MASPTEQKIDGFVAYAPELAKKNDGFDLDGFKKLYEIESGNFWFKSRNKLILSLIHKYDIAGKNYLEIGCGTGFVLHAIEKAYPDMNCWGSEIYTEGLKYTKKRIKRAKLIQMDATRIPFQNQFNLTGAYDVIEHIQDDVRVLNEAYKALLPGGHIIITVPQHPFLWSSADEYACHKRRYTKRELKEKLQKAGFDILMMGSYTSLLFPLMLVSRMNMKNHKYNPDSEFQLPKWLNKLFEYILKIEINLTLLGIHFPFGGSLIAIAQKK